MEFTDYIMYFQMAEVIIDPQNKNAGEILNQGVQAYSVGDYSTAVRYLRETRQLLADTYGQTDDRLGDLYLCYGKALLHLQTEKASGSGAFDGKAEGEPMEEEEQADPSDLEVAGEVLELARRIFEKRGESGKIDLADTLVVLGELSLENETFATAVEDFRKGLEVMETIPSKNDRILAETYFKLGVALSCNWRMKEAIENYTASVQLLKNRIKTLEETYGPGGKVEINQLKSIIPDIEQKIADLKF